MQKNITYSQSHIDESISVLKAIDTNEIELLAAEIRKIGQQGGRLFFLGVGGSAGNAAHAVNDFRKIAHIESYAPTDNVAELTARTNDEGWHSVFIAWLQTSKLNDKDAIFVLSVGGGDPERNISKNIASAVDLAKTRGAKIFGIVGRDGGYTAKHGDNVIVIPTVNEINVTPHSESMQAVIWHLLVSHPLIKREKTMWELSEQKY
jgi:D-sedoheptulose 7-phosphate isomerase